MLAVGAPVSGDTTGAVDDHSDMCYSPAGDHAYRLAIDRPGAYAFRIATPGWSPLLAIVRDGKTITCFTTATPLAHTEQLAAGSIPSWSMAPRRMRTVAIRCGSIRRADAPR